MLKFIAILSFVALLASSALDKSPDLGSASLRMVLALAMLVSLLLAARKHYEDFIG